jgi:hypothetical protein
MLHIFSLMRHLTTHCYRSDNEPTHCCGTKNWSWDSLLFLCKLRVFTFTKRELLALVLAKMLQLLGKAPQTPVGDFRPLTLYTFCRLTFQGLATGLSVLCRKPASLLLLATWRVQPCESVCPVSCKASIANSEPTMRRFKGQRKSYIVR